MLKRIIIVLTFSAIICGCRKKEDIIPDISLVKFSKVLILGNSITYAPQDPSIGWLNNWGMAATTAGNDYVHQLVGRFQKANANCTLQVANISAFETNYNDFDLDAELKIYRDGKPDLLIIRIGENVQPTFDAAAFAGRYQALIAYMKTGNPSLRVLSVGSFFSQRDYVNTIMNKYTSYISLEVIGSDPTNIASDFPGATLAVREHPNDKGMLAISDMIWKTVAYLQ